MVFGSANARAEFVLWIVPIRFEEQAKVSVLFSPENILVFDGAVTVESFSTFGICYLSDFICRKYFVRFGIEHQFVASSNRDHAFVRIGWQPNIEFCVNWVVKNTGCTNNLNHFSRRLAGVNQFEMVNIFPVFVILVREISAGDKYIRAQLRSSSSDLLVSSPNKPPCNEREQNGSYCGDNGIVSFNELSGAMKSRAAFEEQCQTFWLLFARGICLNLVFFALLK